MKSDYFLIIKLAILITILVVFGGFVFKSMSSQSGKEELSSLLKPAKENLTELYFEDHLKLPKYINQSSGEQFRYTIHNLENKGMNYTIRIYKTTETDKVLLREENAYLLNNQSKSFDEILPPIFNQRTKISVELVNKNQDISFWLDKR